MVAESKINWIENQFQLNMYVCLGEYFVIHIGFLSKSQQSLFGSNCFLTSSSTGSQGFIRAVIIYYYGIILYL